jgi:hypothetical protein
VTSLTDPAEEPEVRLRRQQKIIDALIRRADRQHDVGPAAFRAFQSAIELQARVEAQTRDLERAETELESVRRERERTRKGLLEALSTMAEGVALFMDGRLHVTNEFLASLLPDRASDFTPGIGIERFFGLIAESAAFVSSDRRLTEIAPRLGWRHGRADKTVVIELVADRWYQVKAQHTSPETLVLLVTEITELVRRNRFEKATLIDLQEDYLRAVFQHMSSGVCTFSATGDIVLMNQRFLELLDVSSADVSPGMNVGELIDLMRVRGLIGDGDDLRLSTWRQELLIHRKLNRRVGQRGGKVLEIHADRLPDGGFVVEVKDVTLEVRTTEMLEERVKERTAELTEANEKLKRNYEDLAQVEEELRVARDRAEAAISSKTRFLAAASHDLLQPINAAKLLISTLKESTREKASLPLVERLEGAFGSAEQLLRSLLDISRLEGGGADTVTVGDVSLGALLAGIHGDQALLAERKNVRFDVVPCSAVVRSDQLYLLRSIQNLVVNAIQYTPPGGRVLVGCRRRGHTVEVQVWDTGIGIAPSDQSRIFEEFTRARDVPLGSGMGLGLSVVDRACRLLGHGLTVRSKPGVGSVFTISIGMVEGPRRDDRPKGLPARPASLLLNCIVLVVENDGDVLFGMSKWLEKEGASVLAASSIRDAVGFVRDMGMPPDIILADYQLDSGETGIEAIARVRELSGFHVPAILITAHRGDSLREAAFANDLSVMSKPVRLARLRQLIDWKTQFRPAALKGADGAARPAPTKVGGDRTVAQLKLPVSGKDCP